MKKPTNKQIAAYVLYHTSLLGSLGDHLDMHAWEPTEKDQEEIEMFIEKIFTPFQDRMLNILKGKTHEKVREYVEHMTSYNK